ncbi:hypothetical protein MJT46_012259 [Ovis ammon polii x Ovis aries]|nr:hypothetical protein MJT46_012259 [Ovis ammon polii x Ovis aries]
MGNERGTISNWCLAIWCLCFTMTVFISMFECFYHDGHFPFFWYKFPITYACYGALLCLLTSIIYPVLYVQYLPDGPSRDRAIAASTFPCIACVLCAMDVACTWKHYKLRNISCYVHTLPGLLKILESAVACAIFVFLSSTSLYLHQPALKWCVAVYSICFVQFDEKLGGQPHWYSDMSCVDELADYGCIWNQRLAVAVLTAINLLISAADLVYWARQVSVGTEDQPSTPLSLHSQVLPDGPYRDWAVTASRFFSVTSVLCAILLSVLLYVSALVLWPLYQFNEELGRQPQQSSDMGCINGLNYDMCFWDQRLDVAIPTAVNLLVYVADLVYWTC